MHIPVAVLSSRVTATEAEYFKDICDSLHLLYSNEFSGDIVKKVVSCIEKAAQNRFGMSTKARIQGSLYKNTEVNGSDADVLIDTEKPTTRRDREAFAEDLKHLHVFNAHHISLGKLAIHIKFWFDIDVVFRYQVEHGEQSPAKNEFRFKPASQDVVRVLKYYASRMGKRSGFFLEAITLETEKKRNGRNDPIFGDGSMQLFIDVMQALVDESLTNFYVEEQNWKPLLHMAKANALKILHVFLVSRICSPDGFRSPQEIQSWLLDVKNDIIESAAGPVPTWVSNSYTPPPVGISVQFPDLVEQLPKYRARRLCNSPEGDGANQRLVSNDQNARTQSFLPQQPALKLLAENINFSRYLLKPAHVQSEISDSLNPVKLLNLIDLHSSGSEVAGRMLRVRMLWMEGEVALETRNITHGLKLLATALRLAIKDSDPFNGTWTHVSETNKYLDATAEVLKNYPKNTDAILVRAYYYLIHHEWKKAEIEATKGIKIDPCDAYGAIASRGKILGNLGRQKEAIKDWKLAAKLVPEEPIFRYWLAVAERDVGIKDKDKLLKESAIKNYIAFVEQASPEGRKYCEALYARITLLAESLGGKIREKQYARNIYDLYENALLMEAQMLDLFKPFESLEKDTAERFYKTACNILSETELDAVNIFGLKEYSKKKMVAKEYLVANNVFSMILKLNPRDHVTLTQRSLARFHLEMFDDSLQDATEAVKIDSKWILGHIYICRALNEMKRYEETIVAADEGLKVHPENSLLLSIKEAATDALHRKESFDFTTLKCWDKIRYKGAVLVVNSPADLRRILFMCKKPPANNEAGWTVVFRECKQKFDFSGIHVVIGGYKDDLAPGVVSVASELQLIGERDLNSLQDKKENQLSAKVELASINPIFSVGDNGKLVLENLYISMKYLCGKEMNTIVASGGTTILKNSILFSPESSIIAINNSNTRVLVQDCLFRDGCSSAAVVGGGLLEMERCTFINCILSVLDVLENASAKLFECKFSGCLRQALTMYQTCKNVEMTSCVVTKCGSNPDYSGLYVMDGNLKLTNCELTCNEAHAVVVGNATKLACPRLTMENCKVIKNGHGVLFGISGGCGIVRGCVIKQNANFGIAVYNIVEEEFVELCENEYSNNGNKSDIQIFGDANVHLRENLKKVHLRRFPSHS